MTPEEIERRKLHRTWFTWPSWVYYAIYEERRYEEMLQALIKEGAS